MRPATLLKKTLVQVFSCEFCEISKNTFRYRTPASLPFEKDQTVRKTTMVKAS